MKSYRRAYLAHLDRSIDQQRAQQEFLRRQAEAQATLQVQSSPQPSTAKPKLNRKARRKNELFNRKLAARLEKDGTPAEVKVLDDGGIHVTLSKEELEMRHAEEESGDEVEGESHSG